MSVLASSSRVSMHDPQHGGGRWVSSWVFFVTVRPRCLSSLSLSSALGVDSVGAGLSCHLRWRSVGCWNFPHRVLVLISIYFLGD